MPGGTEERPSGWTIDTLRADILSRLSEMDRRYEQRFEHQERAITKAETATEKRFESVNEFRATLGDLTATMMPRGESTARWSAIAERVGKLEQSIHVDSGRSQGVNAAWGYLAGAVGLASAVVAIILAFNK